MKKSNYNERGISRKEFLKRGAAASAVLGAGIYSNGSAATIDRSSEGEARNIIFMVSDGMSAGTLALADLVKTRHYGEETNWIKLYNSDRNFHRGLMDMASLNTPVTDSAAAASSWGCGHRVNNGALCMGPDGENYPTILQIFKNAGKKTGLVTTTRITHATPAGFAVNIPDRNREDEIADQYLEREFDLLLGGGARHFDPEMRDDGTDLYTEFEKKNYAVVRNRQELGSAPANSRLLGTFYDSHLPYTRDRASSDGLRKTVPTLAEMTETALERLQGDPGGFILQIEGGRVDHGAHANDATALIYDQLAFDDAIGSVLEFADGRDDTLVFITTDHGNANPGLNGADVYEEAGTRLDLIQNFRQTNTWILSEIDENSSVQQIRDRMAYATNLDIRKEDAEAVYEAVQGDLATPYRVRNQLDAVLGSVLANYTSVHFIGSSHTADYVELAALGPGIEKLDYYTRNTELFQLMLETAGVHEAG